MPGEPAPTPFVAQQGPIQTPESPPTQTSFGRNVTLLLTHIMLCSFSR